jgi:LAO/AO transport system kinase
MMDVVQRLLAGDQRTLSRLITSLDQRDPAVLPVMKEIDRHTGRAYTIGITGPPGVGKSTLVDALTGLLRQKGLTVGIIAVDPTSPFSGGALLGDRIRMQRHYLDPGVFIRSVSTRGQSGGLPRVVKSLVRLLDASGKDVILVETVGVGQTELGIMGVADTVVVALMPGAGDAIQTLKAGIMEIADIYLVNKADQPGADQMVAAIKSMLELAPEDSNWEPPVVTSQARTGEGLSELWAKVQEHQEFLRSSSLLEQRRSQRRQREFVEAVEEELGRRAKALLERDPNLQVMWQSIYNRELEPYSAALEFLDTWGFPESAIGGNL